MLQQSLGHHNADNSWLFTVCEKILDGARPYSDIIETNPPASFLLYLPAAMLARLLHLPMEFVVSACVFAGALASIAFAGRIARAADMLRADEVGLFRSSAIFALIVLPGFSFAEREHIGVVAILPALVVYAARAQGAGVSRNHAAVAGALCGMTMSLKPHFALVAAFPIVFAIWRRRSIGAAWQWENCAAAGVVCGYAAAVFAFFPNFFEVLPALLSAYVPVKEPLRLLTLEPWFLCNLVLIAALPACAPRGDVRVVVAALASLGFAGAYLLQGKGWVNHGYPGVALALFALCLAIAPGITAFAEQNFDAAWLRARLVVLYCFLPAILGLPVLFGAVIQFTMREEYAGLTEAIRRFAPAHPRLIGLTGDLDIGHPLVRRVDGVWVGQPHSLWLMNHAQLLADFKRGDAALLASFIESDARMFAVNVRQNQPHAILVVRDANFAKMLANPAIAEAMTAYAPAATLGEIEVWTPKQPPQAAR